MANPAVGTASQPDSPRWARGLGWILTMAFVGYGWLLFRAKSWGQIVSMTAGLGDFSWPPWMLSLVLNAFVFTLPVMAMEVWQVRRRDRLVALRLSGITRPLLQGLLLTAIVIFWGKKDAAFIYFQF